MSCCGADFGQQPAPWPALTFSGHGGGRLPRRLYRIFHRLHAGGGDMGPVEPAVDRQNGHGDHGENDLTSFSASSRLIL